MLQNEPENQQSSLPASPIPASQIRVSAEEMTAAINALEEQNARRLEGTVPIGQVVQELHLNATPEEIWAQVQKQRTQAQGEAAKQTQAQVAATGTKKAVARRVLRGWNDIKVWAWIIFWCSGGLGLLSSIPHWVHHGASSAITVSGDNARASYNVNHDDVAVDGDHDTVTLKGNVRNLSVDGDGNTIVIVGSTDKVSVDSDGNTIHWTREPAGKTTQIQDDGDSNHVGLNAP